MGEESLDPDVDGLEGALGVADVVQHISECNEACMQMQFKCE
jgi:hypothetical protein